MNKKTVKTFTCCLCGVTKPGMGNNPQPLDQNPEHRCCDLCNELDVIPERIRRAAAGEPIRG